MTSTVLDVQMSYSSSAVTQLDVYVISLE